MTSSATPEDPQSWNRYSYVGNRPTTVTDPSGLVWAYNRDKDKYQWFEGKLSDSDIADGWKEVSSFVYYAGPIYGYVALNPLRNEWLAGYTDESEATDASRNMSIVSDPAFTVSTAESVDQVMMFTGAAGIAKSLARRAIVGETVTLYRGVNEANVAYDAALNGIAKPTRKWWQFWKTKGATPLEHNTVPGATHNSPYKHSGKSNTVF